MAEEPDTGAVRKAQRRTEVDTVRGHRMRALLLVWRVAVCRFPEFVRRPLRALAGCVAVHAAILFGAPCKPRMLTLAYEWRGRVFEIGQMRPPTDFRLGWRDRIRVLVTGRV